MISIPELTRLFSYIFLGLVPLFLMLISVLIGLDFFAMLFISMFLTIVGAFVAFLLTINPLSKIVGGQEYGVLVFDSKGHLQLYTAIVHGKKFVADIGGKTVKQKFNRNLFWYVSKKIKNGFLSQKEGEENKEVVFETTVDESNISNAVFKTDYPFLVFSSQLNMFITKEWLFKREHDSLFFNLGWELKESIDEHNKAAGGITRYILDLIAQSTKKNKSMLMTVVILVIAVMVLFIFGPMVYDMVNGASIGGDLASPLFEATKFE